MQLSRPLPRDKEGGIKGAYEGTTLRNYKLSFESQNCREEVEREGCKEGSNIVRRGAKAAKARRGKNGGKEGRDG